MAGPRPDAGAEAGPGLVKPKVDSKEKPVSETWTNGWGTSSRWPLWCAAHGPLGTPAAAPSAAGPALPAGSSARGGGAGYLRLAVVEIGGQEAVGEVAFDETGRRQLLRAARGRGVQTTGSRSFAGLSNGQDPRSTGKFLTRDLATLQTGQDVAPVLGHPQHELTDHGPGGLL